MKSMSQLPYNFGVKYRWYPSDKQKEIVKANYDAQMAFYNHLIANKKKLGYIIHTPYYNYALKVHDINVFKRTLKISEMKKRWSWLNDDYIDSFTFAKTYQNNNRAYSNYYHGMQRHPTFHRKNKRPYEQKYQTSYISWKSGKSRKCNIYFVDGRHMVLPRLGKITLGTTRDIRNQYRIGTVTVYKDPLNRYWVSLALASDTPFKKYLKRTHSAIGIDLNISNFLMDNHGHQVANPRFYTKQLPRLRKKQRTESRRERYAKHHHINLSVDKGYQYARKRVSGLNTKIKNERKCFLDRISTRLIKNHDLIVAENLKSKNILRNHKIAQKASDCGWREFLTMLQQKAKQYGRTVILVNPYDTTQKCSKCGFVCTRTNGYHLTLNDREWTCPICHTHHIRDQNAAINILRRGQKEILTKRRQNLISIHRKRTLQAFDVYPNLELNFHRVKHRA